MYSASQREMIGCSSKRELSRRLSRITMEITTSLGSHTVAACFLRRLVPFPLAPSILHRTDDVCLPSYSLLFCLFTRPSSRFRVPKMKSCTCTSGYVRKQSIYLGFRIVFFFFFFVESRGLCVFHCCLDFFKSLFSLSPASSKYNKIFALFCLIFFI